MLKLYSLIASILLVYLIALLPAEAYFPPTTRLHFCGEIVPLEQGTVSQKLAISLAASGGYIRHLQALKQRSAPYFAVIEPILSKHNIPNDFKYLPLIESAWRADAVSSAGAVGYWQFMDDTAKDMGLKIDGETDERQDLRKSTEAACRYIKFLHRKLGSWTLVAAAYNGGIGMLQTKMQRQGHQDFYRLVMNEETSYYLYRILAMKELFTNSSYYAGMAGGLLAYTENPYEREREQARKMGWLQDDDPELTGTPIEPGVLPTYSSEAAHMDSVLTELLRNKSTAFQVMAGDVTARLVKAGKLTVGQSWAFVITQDVQLGEDQLRAGDALYAVVDDVDANGTIFLRATRLVSQQTKQPILLTLNAMNPTTGLAGIVLPKPLKPGWEVQWKLE